MTLFFSQVFEEPFFTPYSAWTPNPLKPALPLMAISISSLAQMALSVVTLIQYLSYSSGQILKILVKYWRYSSVKCQSNLNCMLHPWPLPQPVWQNNWLNRNKWRRHWQGSVSSSVQPCLWCCKMKACLHLTLSLDHRIREDCLK